MIKIEDYARDREEEWLMKKIRAKHMTYDERMRFLERVADYFLKLDDYCDDKYYRGKE